MLSGTTRYKNDKNDQSKIKYLENNVMINLGGMNASELLAEKTKLAILQEGKINPTLSSLYFLSKIYQIAYIRYNETNDSADDVQSYIKNINKLYKTSHLDTAILRRYNKWSLLNPLLFFSVYSWITGKETKLPLICGYLPSVELLLTPYGPELGIQNFLKTDDRKYQLGLFYGKNQHVRSYQISLSSDCFLNYQKISIGGDFHLWKQPKLLTDNFKQAPIKTGGLLKINSQYNINKNTIILTDIGYKTTGFIRGYPLREGLIIKVGIGINC